MRRVGYTPSRQGLGGAFRLGEAIMPENLQREEERAAKIQAYPINLQSFLQTTLLIATLIGGVVYADRRITKLEMNSEYQARQAEEQKLMMKESLDKLNRALENQEKMLRDINENRRRERK